MTDSRRRVWPIVVLAVVALIVLFIWQPWRPSADAFRQSDSDGYSACRSYNRSLGEGGDIRSQSLSNAANSGLRSTTPEIRELVDDRNGGADGIPLIRDHGDFKDACKAAGYRF